MVRARFRVEGTGVCLQSPQGDIVTVWGRWEERDGRIGRSKRPSRTGLVRVGGDVRLSVGWLRHRRCRQAGSGIARSRARERLNWVSQGQCLGRCKVRRRAERVSRPARAKNRRRRVLVVTICSPQPIRAVQRARRFGDFGYLEGRSNQFEWEINQYQKISIKMIGAEPNRATTPPRTLSVIVFPVTANHKPIAKIGTVPTNKSKIIEDKFL